MYQACRPELQQPASNGDSGDTDKDWRHLDAEVGCHSVELRFIAAAIVSDASIEPHACFHGSVCACEVVAVLLQDFLCCCG